MADNPIYGIGLCGGALGLELGLEAAIRNYRTVAVVERETAVAGRMAQRIEEGSLPPLAWWDDVSTFDGNPWRGVVHIVSAGFPCQPFSVAGKHKGKKDERWIWPSIADRIEEVEPEIVFLENVPGLLLSTDSEFDRWDVEDSPVDSVGGFGTVLSDLAELGFHAEWLCLRASDVGASHGRKRVFILAYRNGARLDRYAWKHVGGQSPLPTRSGERGGLLEHAASIRAGESADEIYPFAIGGEARAQSGGGCIGMEHAEPIGHQRDARSGWKAITGTGSTGEVVGHSVSERLEIGRCVGGNTEPERAPIERTGAELGHSPGDDERYVGQHPGIFAYGPSDPRWQDVLVQYPWLRPSYSQAEAESDLRDLVDGMVDLVVSERTGALRALGNGVVPLQASVAFRVLLKRVLSAST